MPSLCHISMYKLKRWRNWYKLKHKNTHIYIWLYLYISIVYCIIMYINMIISIYIYVYIYICKNYEWKIFMFSLLITFLALAFTFIPSAPLRGGEKGWENVKTWTRRGLVERVPVSPAGWWWVWGVNWDGLWLFYPHYPDL